MAQTVAAPDTALKTSGGGGGSAVTIADGADITQGAEADAAITGDNSGTISAKMRGLSKILFDIWDSTNHLFHQNIKQIGGASFAQGQRTMANSISVALASDQSAFETLPSAQTSGGSTPYHALSAGSTNSTNVKASNGQIYGLRLSNTTSSAIYFKLYNKATAPLVGTDTPISTIQVPANATVIEAFPVGLYFSNGIGYGSTAAVTDTDTTAITANALVIDLDYK